MTTMKIGEMAKATGLTIETLRYYEKIGLMNQADRSLSGYRLFNQENIKRLRFITRAKSVGFSLNSISDMLALSLDKTNASCSDVKKIADKKLLEIEAKINELKSMHSSLSKLSRTCCGSSASAHHCSILSSFEVDE